MTHCAWLPQSFLSTFPLSLQFDVKHPFVSVKPVQCSVGSLAHPKGIYVSKWASNTWVPGNICWVSLFFHACSSAVFWSFRIRSPVLQEAKVCLLCSRNMEDNKEFLGWGRKEERSTYDPANFVQVLRGPSVQGLHWSSFACYHIVVCTRPQTCNTARNRSTVIVSTYSQWLSMNVALWMNSE